LVGSSYYNMKLVTKNLNERVDILSTLTILIAQHDLTNYIYSTRGLS